MIESIGGRGTPADEQIAQRAAWQVGRALTIAATVLVLVAVAALTFAVTVGSRHESNEHSSREDVHSGAETAWVIDRDKMIVLIIVFGILAIAASGVVGWWAARRAARPLAEALQRQRAFVADASHELRTPLTVLSTRVQLLRRRMQAGEAVTDLIDALDRDAQSLTATLDDLLLAAARPQSKDLATEVDRTARAAADAMTILATRQHVHLAVDAASGALVSIPPKSLERCVTALIDNALAHSPANTTVTVSARVQGDMVTVSVSDQGTGIVGIPLERIFDRFAHEDGPRRAHGGFGIGLSLVRQIVTQYGGTAVVAHTGSDGTTITISLPILG